MLRKMSDYEVERIIGFRRRKNGLQYLVRWKNFGPADDTWEPEKNLHSCPDILEAFKQSAGIIPGQEESAPPVNVEVDYEPSFSILARSGIPQHKQVSLKETFATATENVAANLSSTLSLVSPSTSTYTESYVSSSQLITSPYQQTNQSKDNDNGETNYENDDDDDDDDDEIIFKSVPTKKNWSRQITITGSRNRGFLEGYLSMECLRRNWILIVLYICTFVTCLYFTDLPSRILSVEADKESPKSSTMNDTV